MRNRPITLISLLLVSVAATAVSAQDGTTEQLWGDYHLHYYHNDRQEFYGDGGVRFLLDSNAWRKIYVRPSMRLHRWGNVEPHFALGLFYTENKGAANTLELRPTLGLRVRWPRIGPLTFSNYVRLEYRATWDSDGGFSSSGRLRYKLATRIPLQVAPAHLHLDKWYVPISLEAFFDVGENVDVFFRDEGRFDFGLGYNARDTWVFEFHFIVQQSRSGQASSFDTDDFIFRLQFKHLLRAFDYRFTEEDLPES